LRWSSHRASSTIRTKHLDTLVHTFLSTIHACFARHDFVHYQTLGPAIFSFVPRLFGIKTVVTVQGLDWKGKKWSRAASLFLKVGEWAAARFPNRTVVFRSPWRKYFRDRYGSGVTYVPNGTELRDRKSGDLLKSFGIEPDRYALFLERLSPEKNCDLLIEAFEGISTPLKLVFAGGSSHSDEHASALRKRASQRVLFLDWLAGDALDAVLTNAALFVLPSDLERMSLALLDAMGAGVCVLASDIPENREAVGDAGFTFKAGDVTDLRRMLDFLLSDEVIRSVVADEARKRVRENYLWADVTAKIEQIYFELASHREEPVRSVRATTHNCQRPGFERLICQTQSDKSSR
jgi:glycosyltransferase involved in cell wall biosynthesis